MFLFYLFVCFGWWWWQVGSFFVVFVCMVFLLGGGWGGRSFICFGLFGVFSFSFFFGEGVGGILHNCFCCCYQLNVLAPFRT